MGKMTEPTGLCFPWAAQNSGKDDVVVHGMVMHPMTRKRFAHAWIERGDTVLDWQTRDHVTPWKKSSFYETVKPTKMVRYSPWEAKVMCLRHGHSGPWGRREQPTIKEVRDSLRKLESRRKR